MNAVLAAPRAGGPPRLSLSAQFVAATGAATVGMGERLGLYDAIGALGEASSLDLAKERCLPLWLTEGWLAAQAAGGYLTRDDRTNKYRLGCELRRSA